MATQEKNQLGDGSDNYAGAAKQAANAAKSAKEAGKTAAKETAKKGAEATSRAAAATVKASVEGGKAAAQIAAGTAAGGPVGAAISIAWSMRHTLFKILICVCLSLTFLIVMIVSLPSIIMDSIFGTNGTQPVEGVTITSVYDSLVVDVSNAVENGYNTSMSKVENIIRNGGYDYETSMAATINYAQSSAGYEKAVRTFSDIESKLSKELNGENLKLFNELVNASDEISATSGVENFKIGFRLGVLMMCDSLFSDNSIIMKD